MGFLEDYFFSGFHTALFEKIWHTWKSSSRGNDVHFHQLETPKTTYFQLPLKKCTFLCFLGSHFYRQKNMVWGWVLWSEMNAFQAHEWWTALVVHLCWGLVKVSWWNVKFHNKIFRLWKILTVCRRYSWINDSLRSPKNQVALNLYLPGNSLWPFLGWLSDRFKGCWWPPTLGDKKVTKNHLVCFFFLYAFLEVELFGVFLSKKLLSGVAFVLATWPSNQPFVRGSSFGNVWQKWHFEIQSGRGYCT